MTEAVDIRARQDPLCQRYRDEPADARIVDKAQTLSGADLDPVHGKVKADSHDYGIVWDFGIHEAVGGDHDLPNPGDFLCAALSACLDSTIRMIANRLAITITHLAVTVTAEVDVRGTLMVARDVPVGFQKMNCEVNLEVDENTPEQARMKLIAGAEKCCVVLQTLQSGVPVELRVVSDD